MTLDENEAKSFDTKKKHSKYVHVISFKLDKERKGKLDTCLWFLKVKGKHTSDTMREFVDKLYDVLMDSGSHDLTSGVLKKEKRELKTEVSKLNKSNTQLTKKVERLEQILKEVGVRKKGFGYVIRKHLKQPKPHVKATPQPKEKPTKPAMPNSTITPKPSMSEPTHKEPLIIKNDRYTPDYITCYRDKQAYKPLELPCIKDVNFKCNNDVCRKQILDIIGFK